MSFRFLHHACSFGRFHLATEILYDTVASSKNNRTKLSLTFQDNQDISNLPIKNLSKARDVLAGLLESWDHLFEYSVYKELNKENQKLIRRVLADHLAEAANHYNNYSIRTYNVREHCRMVEKGIAFNAIQHLNGSFTLTSSNLPADLFENGENLTSVLVRHLPQVATTQRDKLHEQTVIKKSICC